MQRENLMPRAPGLSDKYWIELLVYTFNEGSLHLMQSSPSEFSITKTMQKTTPIILKV